MGFTGTRILCDLRLPERHISLKLHANTYRELEWCGERTKPL